VTTTLTTWVLIASVMQTPPEPRWTAPVGVVVKVDNLVLSGTELEARPLDDRKRSVVLRILNTYRHGNAHRYDLEFYGLDPGTFDLRDALRRKDNSPVTDLPPMLVRVTTQLPPGQVTPQPLALESGVSLGGYRLWLILGGIVWIIGLLLILFAGRKRMKRVTGPPPPPSLAARLEPLVESALAGTAAPADLANLERALLTYWRRKLKLVQGKPEEVSATLRQHPEAGALLVQLESWLHRPGPRDAVDPKTLLEPYRRLPADTLDHDLAGARS
jgi:hypothetical protein